MTDASTTSRPLFNRQQLISLFLPLVAEQALSISIGLADTLMVSSVGEAAVSPASTSATGSPNGPRPAPHRSCSL